MSATRAPTAPSPPERRSDGHPRIRARRAEVARSASRRRLHRLNVVLAVVCVAVWALVAARSPFLDVDHVQVTGTHRTDAADVGAASGIRPGDSMAEIDLGAARARVADLPWVDTVRMHRMWPGTVQVVIVERTALAVVEAPPGWARVDAEGRVLDIVSRRPEALIGLTGARSVAPGGLLPAADRSALRTLARLPADLVIDVVGAQRVGLGLVVDLADGFEVVVGDASDLLAKADAAQAVRSDADVADGCRIDVRVPAAPFLTEAATCA